jgi:AcrR family transcriptional regulator
MDTPQEIRKPRKAEQTRQRIQDSALELFASKGYEGTTMRDIAARAGCSPGLAYRYFSSKEEMVLELYRSLCQNLEAQVQTLPATTLAERFEYTMQAQFVLMAPYRETFAALFGAALNPHSAVAVFGEQTADVRRYSRSVLAVVATGAKDAPRAAQQEDIATILYGLHLIFILFWLQDRSQEQTTTRDALTFARDLLALLRPILRLPPVAQMLARLASILGPMFGNDKLQNDDKSAE